MPRSRPERRHHVVYVTRNTEYHCRDQECVGVRDRATGSWLREHPAVRARILGAVCGNSVRPRPEAGLRLLFNGQQMVVTSKLVAAGRPEREDIFCYVSLCRSGEIAA